MSRCFGREPLARGRGTPIRCHATEPRKLKFRHGRLFRGGDYSRNPRRVREEFGLRWLTAEFEPGDVVVFSPFTMHGSLDNRSPRFRISIDARYQRAADPIDERWIGERPIAHSRAE